MGKNKPQIKIVLYPCAYFSAQAVCMRNRASLLFGIGFLTGVASGLILVAVIFPGMLRQVPFMSSILISQQVPD